jgi:hypothetical protein
MPAAAQPYRRPPGQPESTSLRVYDLKIALYADGPVIANRYFRRSHIHPLARTRKFEHVCSV